MNYFMAGTGKNSEKRRQQRRWSQNFLQDRNVAARIVDALGAGQQVVEIGPGPGTLTRYLVEKYRRVLAVEVDPDLAEQLPGRLGFPQNLQVLREDFLNLNLRGVLQEADGQSDIIGNIPYHITSPILFRILDFTGFLRRAVLMVQKEVGERITAAPGSKTYGIPSVLAQFHADSEYLFTVPAALFKPKPKVHSAVIRLCFHHEKEKQVADKKLFTQIVRHTFGQRRKMLRNTLSALFPKAILESVQIDLTRRPEGLSVEEFIRLANQISDKAETGAHEPHHE